MERERRAPSGGEEPRATPGGAPPPRFAPPRHPPRGRPRNDQAEAPGGEGAPGRPPPDAYRSAPGVGAGAAAAGGRGDRTLALPGTTPRNPGRAAH